MKLFKSSFIHLIYSLSILFGSILPIDQPRVSVFFDFDKIIHFIAYCILVILSIYAYKKINKVYFKSFIYAFSLGIFIELIQYFLPYRFFELADVVVNGLGAIFGVVIMYSFKIRGERRKIH